MIYIITYHKSMMSQWC